jgi:signal transduction histidine kinase/ligand-binding sensor domain-containing protein
MSLFFQKSLFFALYLLPFISSGQESMGNSPLFYEQPYPLQQAGVKDVDCIFKDSRQIMWFGTDNGLFRFDGLNVKYYSHRTGDSNSIAKGKINNIKEDRNGNIWVATFTGVSVINPFNYHCHSYLSGNHSFDTNGFDNRMCIDKSGVIWVGNSTGIFLFDTLKMKFVNVWSNRIPGIARSQYIVKIIDGNDSVLVASTFHELVLLNKKDRSFRRLSLSTYIPRLDTIITSLMMDARQNLWVGTWGNGLYKYNLQTKKLSHVNELDLLYKETNFIAASLCETINKKNNPADTSNAEDVVWIGTNEGVISCNLKYNDVTTINYYKHSNNDNKSIIPGITNAFLFDSDGALWTVGSNGVCKCFPFRNNFKQFAFLKGLITGFSPIKIDGKKWYFITSWHTRNKGMLIVDSLGNKAPFEIDPKFNDEADSRNFSGIVKDKYNRLWISSLAGVAVMTDKNELLKKWDKNSPPENNLSRYHTNEIKIYKDTVWIACYHGGIDLFDLSFNKIGHYSASSGSGLKDNIVSSFYTDSKGNLWICGDAYLYKYIPGSHSPQQFKCYNLSPELVGFGPRNMCETPGGEFLIASSIGLVRFNPNTEKYSILQSPLMQKEQGVSDVAIDKKGDIWYLTSEHLVYLENNTANKPRFILFGDEDGLNTMYNPHILKTINGSDFYIAGDDKIIEFNASSLEQPFSPPALEMDMHVNDSIADIPKNNVPITLPHNKNKIDFEFTGVTYIKADQNEYYYKLSELDKDWNITYKNSVSYANLAPGHYTFTIKAKNYAGLWSNTESVEFTILPPFWNTWWFRISMSIIILILLTAIIRIISRRRLKERILQLEKETALEKERTRIAQDMHDDLGSGLTKIAIMSEVVKKQLPTEEKLSSQLQVISDSSRKLVDNLQDIVWMLNPAHDTLDRLALYVQAHAIKYFEDSPVKVSFTFPAQVEPLKISEEKRRNIFMVVKESLNNIIKHSEARNAEIELTVSANEIHFTITDDGKGFSPGQSRTFANGLANMLARMKKIGGTCNIDSAPGKGTRVELSLPI